MAGEELLEGLIFKTRKIPKFGKQRLKCRGYLGHEDGLNDAHVAVVTNINFIVLVISGEICGYRK